MFTPANSPPSLFTLVFLTALSVLSLNMFLPSLAAIAAEFGVSYAQASLAISGYLGITAFLQVVFGPLSDRYGRRPVMLAGLVLFVIASLGALLAWNIWAFLVFRVAQGAVISAMALSRAVVRDTRSPDEAAGMLGYIGMAMAIAPLLGPALGGLLDEVFGWRANFVAYVGVGLFALWLAWADLGETNADPSPTFTRQFQTYPELLRSRRFWGYTICLSFSIGAFYAYIAGVPAVAQEFGLSPTLVGLAMGAPTIGFFFGNFVTGKLAGRKSVLYLTMAGRIAGSLGLVAGVVLYMAGAPPLAAVFFGVLFLGFGNGLTIPGANAGAMSVRPQLAGSASGLSGAITVAAGAVLSWATAAVLPASGGALVLLLVLAANTVAGLAAAVYVAAIDRREGPITD